MSETSTETPVVALTGAHGYLGRRCAELFQSAGWHVVALGRRIAEAPDAVELRLGEPVRAESFRGARALVHCAYDFRLTRRADIERVNVRGSIALLDAARSIGIEKIVYVSSISAFEGCTSVYGQAKLAVEAHALRLRGIVIRPGLIFDEPPGGTFGRLAEQARTARLIPLLGDGSQIQYLVHNTDVAACILRCCVERLPEVDRPMTLAHPRPWPLRELLLRIAQQSGRKPVLVPTPWRLVWAALKTAEVLRLPIEFRSDSVVSLMNQNPSPDFEVAAAFGAVCRPFA